MPLKVQSRGPASRPKQASPANAAAPSTLPFGLIEPPKGSPQLPAGVSLCMIVKNEEQYLEQCLASIGGAVDEICVVDTGSSDRTIEIAKRFGARVEGHAWRDDFAWARNKAIDMATKRWIIMLDADEELAPEGRASLARLKSTPAGTCGLYLRCENLSDDYKGTGTMSHLLARIFPNNPRIRYTSPIHEYITIDGKETGIDTKLSDIRIIHHGYLAGIVSKRDKASRNLAMIRRACDDEPDNAFHWYNLGMTAHVVKDYGLAIEGFERMRDLLQNRERGFLPVALVTLAECYSELNNDEERALEVVQTCLTAVPHFSNAHFTQGRILAKLGRREEARSAFLAAIEDGKHRDVQFVVDDQIYQWKAQLSIGISLGEEQRWEEAIEWYDKGLQNQPSVQPLLFNRAHALEQSKRLEEAHTAFRELYERFRDELSIVQYINFLLRQNKKQEAVELMERTIGDVSPRVAATFFTAAAQLAQRDGNAFQELQYLQRAHACDPAAGPVLDALEQLYTKHNDVAMLRELQTNEFTYEPVEAADFARRSYRLIALGKLEEAARYAELGLKLAPQDGKLRYNAAAAYVQLGRPQEALNHLCAIAPDAKEVGERAGLLRANVLRDAGSAAQAVDILDELIVRAPDRLEPILLKAKCLEDCGRAGEAAALLEGSLALDLHRVSIELGTLYLRTGRFAEAQRLAENALAG